MFSREPPDCHPTQARTTLAQPAHAVAISPTAVTTDHIVVVVVVVVVVVAATAVIITAQTPCNQNSAPAPRPWMSRRGAPAAPSPPCSAAVALGTAAVTGYLERSSAPGATCLTDRQTDRQTDRDSHRTHMRHASPPMVQARHTSCSLPCVAHHPADDHRRLTAPTGAVAATASADVHRQSVCM
eukprot:COSAG01_NODE_36_length_34092_cov_26.350032_2_plen_184_part_00